MSKGGLAETARQIEAQSPSAKVLSIVVDVTDEQSVQDMVERAVQEFGTLECGKSYPILSSWSCGWRSSLTVNFGRAAANAAGVIVNSREKTAHVPSSEFDRVMGINARSVALCTQAELRVMLKQPRKLTGSLWTDERRAQAGSIVNFASVCGFVAMPNVMPYVAAKHAVMGLTKSAAIEHAADGLRINAVCPGIVDTPFIASLKAAKGGNEQDPVFANPKGRLCYPDEIADAVVFLSSTMSSYVNGVGLVSDGGKSVQY